jgi:hypothetical protein
MADTVTSNVLFTGAGKHTLLLTNICDGTGEANVVKVDKSAFTNRFGGTVGPLRILKCKWNMQGFTYVRLHWDHDADDTAMVLSGDGEMCFNKAGGLKDPGSAGGTGDLLLSTVGHTAGDTYTIMLSIGF